MRLPFTHLIIQQGMFEDAKPICFQDDKEEKE